MIKLSNITKVFQQGTRTIQALNNVSLHVPAGQIYGVIGASGAGKSTLIRCVNLLERPTEGSVQVGGQELTTLSESELTKARRQIGMIFQHFNLLSSRTVFGNVALPLELDNTPKEEIKRRVTELLDLVGLGDKHDSYAANLSGGQKQRVAIARALASQPKVLLCDEATSALDPATTRSILELLKDINRRLGLTILLITHEMDVVKRICDCVAVISNGELIEQDTVSEVFSHPKTPLAQKFIQSTLHLDIPEDYQERLKAEPEADSVPMLRMEFTGHSVDAPLLSEIARRFNVNNNIISAQMDYAGGVKFGIMLTEMHGAQEDTQAAINWLQEHHVKVEVLGYVLANDVAASSRRMGNAGNDLCVRFFWLCDWPARRRTAVRHASGANHREREALSYAVSAGQYFPLHPIHYTAGMDDSIYPHDCRHLDRFTGRYRPADRGCRTVYCPNGRKCAAGNPDRAD